MNEKSIVISHITDGTKIVWFDEQKNMANKNNVFVSGYDQDSHENVYFYVPADRLACMRNKALLTDGNLIKIEISDEDDLFAGCKEIMEIMPTNFHDLTVQIIECPELLMGKDPITERYALRVRLLDSAERGKEAIVHVSKGAFYKLVRPVASKNVYSPMNILQEEDTRLLIEKGDVVTLRSCMAMEDNEYESLGTIQRKPFDARVTVVSRDRFLRSRFGEGGVQCLTVMFNNSHLIGRIARLEFSSLEPFQCNPNACLELSDALKYGLSGRDRPIHVVPGSVKIAEPDFV